MRYTDAIKPGVSIKSRRFRTGENNFLLSCPKTPRLHARSSLYDIDVFLGYFETIEVFRLGSKI